MDTKTQKQDIPLPLALALLAAVLVLVATGSSVGNVTLFFDQLDQFLTLNDTLLLIGGVALTFNVVVLSVCFSRLYGFRRQGSRLRALRGERKGSPGAWPRCS